MRFKSSLEHHVSIFHLYLEYRVIEIKVVFNYAVPCFYLRGMGSHSLLKHLTVRKRVRLQAPKMRCSCLKLVFRKHAVFPVMLSTFSTDTLPANLAVNTLNPLILPCLRFLDGSRPNENEKLGSFKRYSGSLIAVAL